MHSTTRRRTTCGGVEDGRCDPDADNIFVLQFTKKRLLGEGFIIFSKAVNLEDVDLILQEVGRDTFIRKTRNIFNPNTKRRVGALSEMKGKTARGRLEDIISTTMLLRLGADSKLEPDKPSVLVSEPSCARQFAHRDYPKRGSKTRKKCASYRDLHSHGKLSDQEGSDDNHDEIVAGIGAGFPVSGLLALQSGTKFGLWKHSHDADKVYNDEMQVVDLDPGDILMFHGSLVHCGMDYEARNIRVHW
ncbi:unnamed protein product, partial [Discosporangium mesarthrocarpum]